MVAVAPVMESDADLEDPVVEPTDRTSGIPPQRLEDLVLLEELAGVEQLDAADERLGRRLSAARARSFVDLATGDALGRPLRFALAASGLGRVQP
jgi:hypothetical protein